MIEKSMGNFFVCTKISVWLFHPPIYNVFFFFSGEPGGTFCKHIHVDSFLQYPFSALKKWLGSRTDRLGAVTILAVHFFNPETTTMAVAGVVVEINVATSLRIRLHVLRKGLTLPSYSEGGIKTIHPTLRKGMEF